MSTLWTTIRRTTTVIWCSAIAIIGMAGAGLVSTTPAGAVPAVAATSPAGTYSATLMAQGIKVPGLKLTLTTTGTFVLNGLAKGKWSESGTTVKLRGALSGTPFDLTATQIGNNLGSKSHPGTITNGQVKEGTWYAIRK